MMQSPTLRFMRVLGALAVLAVGAVHLQQYAGSGYNAVPTIGPLFLLNGIAAGIIGVALLLPWSGGCPRGAPMPPSGYLRLGLWPSRSER